MAGSEEQAGQGSERGRTGVYVHRVHEDRTDRADEEMRRSYEVA
ncbi:hypothetical protein [Bacillus sp. LL01]|nr:hypothetical protein [Bacillus sp. LL01]